MAAVCGKTWERAWKKSHYNEVRALSIAIGLKSVSLIC